EAEATVEDFQRAMYAGDTEKAKSYVTADNQEIINSMASSISASGVKFEVKDIKLRTVKESLLCDEAEVEIVDISLHASTGRFTFDYTLDQVKNTLGIKRWVYTLNRQNGKWLITGGGGQNT
ncbi:MAG: hypothetical protein MUO75_04015, partial [Actinobacteria bacterium]|nr:hypothetical protein [Actinomycetota bacterium]